MPSGISSLRRCSINAEFSLKDFTNLLASHLNTFKELARIQAEAFSLLNRPLTDKMEALLTRQSVVSHSLSEERIALNPYLTQWTSMDREIRDQMMLEGAGEILRELEETARGIQERHDGWFGGSSTSDSPETSQAQGEGLSDMVRFYRGLR